MHPGHSVAEVIDNTGFDFDRPADVPTTPAPSADTLHTMRIVVGPMLTDVYPQFAKSVFGASIPCPKKGRVRVRDVFYHWFDDERAPEAGEQDPARPPGGEAEVAR